MEFKALFDKRSINRMAIDALPLDLCSCNILIVGSSGR
jgi:hypothetical protein